MTEAAHRPQPVLSPPSTVKICTLGESGAGKSSLILKLITNDFQKNQQTTIGAAFLAWNAPDGKTRLEIWDTAGQERYATLAPMYYRNAAGILVVFDMTDTSSFERAERWLEELREAVSPAVLVLVGNKYDLAANLDHIKKEDAEALADKYGAAYFETSAATGHNVQEVFKHIADNIPSEAAPAPGIVITQPPVAPQKSSCC